MLQCQMCTAEIDLPEKSLFFLSDKISLTPRPMYCLVIPIHCNDCKYRPLVLEYCYIQRLLQPPKPRVCGSGGVNSLSHRFLKQKFFPKLRNPLHKIWVARCASNHFISGEIMPCDPTSEFGNEDISRLWRHHCYTSPWLPSEFLGVVDTA